MKPGRKWTIFLKPINLYRLMIMSRKNWTRSIKRLKRKLADRSY